MKALIWAEHRKLRRSKIVWIAVFAIVMVAVIVFAQGQFSFGEKRYIEGVGWFMTAAQSLATFFLLPAVIALLGSYLICREEQEDTMKSLHLILCGGCISFSRAICGNALEIFENLCAGWFRNFFCPFSSDCLGSAHKKGILACVDIC